MNPHGMTLRPKGLRVVSKSEFCADIDKSFRVNQNLYIRGDMLLPCYHLVTWYFIQFFTK